MRPPVCAVCHKSFRDFPEEAEFALLRFRETEADRAHNQRLNQSGMTGHPAAAEWFCPDHAPAARELTDLTVKEALARPELQDNSDEISLRPE